MVQQPTVMVQQPTVMIVDDDPANVDIFEALFEDAGFIVEHAYSGKEAIQVLKKSPHIQLLFLDLQMPQMDGYDTIRAIRKDPSIAQLPVVAISADHRSGVKQRCFHAGVDVFLPKPIDKEFLIETKQPFK